MSCAEVLHHLFAYLDLASGSMIIQLLLGGAARDPALARS